MSGRVNSAPPGLNGVAEASAIREPAAEAAPGPGAAAPGSPGPGAYPATLALALLAFHRHVGPIFKGTEAKYGKFADLHAVLEVVTTPLLDQGLLLTQTLEEKAGSATQAPPAASAHPFGIPVAGSTADGGDACGQSLLRTQLLHAPSGQAISSVVPLPTLNEMLGRLHELRLLAIEQFPLDLDLAALGAVPFGLPPRPPTGAAPAQPGSSQSPGPGPMTPALARQPGLRLDDQIRGLQSLLQSLGTTTNPLHSIGAAITYLRRYQILALLSLAAEDNDGNLGKEAQELGQRSMGPMPISQGAGLSLVGRPATAVSTSPMPAAAFPMASSNGAASSPRSAPVGQQGARGRRLSRPVGTTPTHGAATATVLEDVPAAPVQPAAREPTPAQTATAAVPGAKPTAEAGNGASGLGPKEQAMAPFDLAELGDGAVQALIAEIRTLPSSAIPQLVQAFRLQFGLPAEAMVSDYIRTSGHAAFIREQIASLGGGHQPGNGNGKGEQA